MPSQMTSGNLTQQLCFENKLALFVLLARLKGLIILPSHCLFALFAKDVADDMSTGCHVSLARFPLGDVYDAIEEVGFAMLAAEVLLQYSYS
jgi:hypothetical protein